MKKVFVAVFLAVGLLVAPASANEANQCSCERKIRVKLSQVNYTLNPMAHLKNAANAVSFDLPVPCSFYDHVNVGDDLLNDKFRWGSLMVHGSFSNWKLKVESK